jgi:hypothetical protein
MHSATRLATPPPWRVPMNEQNNGAESGPQIQHDEYC